MTSIAILGSGRVAAPLAGGLATAGHALTIGSRDAAAASAKWTGPAVTFTDLAEAARAAEVVINATPGDSSLRRRAARRVELDGKVLLDVSNAARRGSDGFPGGLLYPDGSLAEHLQEALPDTHVVKTLNTMLFSVMANPRALKIPPTAFLSGNDAAAKAVAGEILHDLGWPPEWVEDLGDVGTARGPEALVLLVPAIIRSRGFAPFALALAR